MLLIWLNMQQTSYFTALLLNDYNEYEDYNRKTCRSIFQKATKKSGQHKQFGGKNLRFFFLSEDNVDGQKHNHCIQNLEKTCPLWARHWEPLYRSNGIENWWYTLRVPNEDVYLKTDFCFLLKPGPRNYYLRIIQCFCRDNALASQYLMYVYTITLLLSIDT